MLKASNISFYTLFDAGYISADTYRALKPKKRLMELSFSECEKYSKAISKELKRLFEDDDLIRILSQIEFLERDLNTAYPSSIETLAKLQEDAPVDIKTIIRKVGDRAFLSRYVLCTFEVLRNLCFILDDNIELVEQFRHHFINIFFSELHPSNAQKLSKSQQESSLVIAEDPKTFYGKDNIKIEDDAVFPKGSDNHKYIKYLFSLDAIQFKPFERKIEEELISLPVRLGNSIRFVGYRAFFVNYLFAEDSKLLKLRNFGRKSLQDCNNLRTILREFVSSNYNEFSFPEEVNNANAQPLTIKEILGPYKYSILIENLHSLIREQSTRVKNSIAEITDDIFIESYVHHDGCLMNLRKVGKHSAIELEKIISKLKDKLKYLESQTMTEEDILWLRISSAYGNNIDSFTKKFYTETNHLPMIHILLNIFMGMLSIRNFKIVNEVRPFDKSIPGKSYEMVAGLYDLSRERVRQLCEKCVDFLLQRPNVDERPNTPFFNIISKKEDWDYMHDLLIQKKLWKKEDFSAISAEEDSNLSTDYIVTVLSNIFRDEFTIIGKTPILNQRRNVTWRNTFMVKTELTNVFDFDKMWTMTTELINNTVGINVYRSQELVLDIFNDAWKELDVTYLADIEHVATELLINEFCIIPELDGSICIKGNKQVNTSNALYEILKENGDPLTLIELFDKFDELCPGRYKSAMSLKSIISKDARMYTISNTNLVSLYEWEHVAMGSIRDLIVDFLAEHEEPQPVTAIIAHIKSLRSTTDNSIRSTMNTGDQFQQFEGGFYGLSDRTYPEWCYLSESERISRKNIVDLDQFIATYNHFPFSQSSDANENRLYVWFAKMKRSKDLSAFLKTAICQLEQKYAEIPKNRSEHQWVLKLQEYKNFVLLNKRKPSKNFANESFLYKWFEKTLNHLEEDRLTKWQVKMFYELCGLF